MHNDTKPTSSVLLPKIANAAPTCVRVGRGRVWVGRGTCHWYLQPGLQVTPGVDCGAAIEPTWQWASISSFAPLVPPRRVTRGSATMDVAMGSLQFFAFSIAF